MDKGWNDRENGEGGQQKSPRSIAPRGLLFHHLGVALHHGSMGGIYYTGPSCSTPINRRKSVVFHGAIEKPDVPGTYHGPSESAFFSYLRLISARFLPALRDNSSCQYLFGHKLPRTDETS